MKAGLGKFLLLLVVIGCSTNKSEIEKLLNDLSLDDAKKVSNVKYILSVDMDSFSCGHCLSDIKSSIFNLKKLDEAYNNVIVVLKFFESPKFNSLIAEKYFKKKTNSSFNLIAVKKSKNETLDIGYNNFLLVKQNGKFIKTDLPITRQRLSRLQIIH